jgi:hypothetical protein
MSEDLKAQFHEAVRQLCDRVRTECGRPSSGLERMIGEPCGAYLAAKRLLRDPRSKKKTLEWVWKNRRPDLTVEFVIIDGCWGNLFDPVEISEAQKRYNEYVEALYPQK